MKKLFLMVCLLLGITACSSDENLQIEEQQGINESTTIKVEFENVLHSALHSEHPLAQNHLVIENASDWKILQDQIRIVAQTVIDFNQYTVIAVFDQARTDTGCTIDIVAVTELATNVEIAVDRLNKVGIALSPSLPYHIVKIPKTNKPLTFKLI